MATNQPKLKAGLLINPIAGLGGPLAMKGTDGMAAKALAKGARPKAAERVQAFLQALGSNIHKIEWRTAPGPMGADALAPFKLDFTPAPTPSRALGESSAEDSRQAAKHLDGKVDLLLFAGGDGTARDLADTLAQTPAVLGIPAGVKMHSGVFATSPAAAAALVTRLLNGDLLSVTPGQVRDLDEALLRKGKVQARHHGALPVPNDLRYLQHVKEGGKESEPLVIEELAAEMAELGSDGALTLVGAGTTLAGVMSSWGLESTLLGIDALEGKTLIAKDLTEPALWKLLQTHKQARLLLSFTGGQGYVFGRGNQQLSPRCLKRIGKPNMHLLATKTKLRALDGRPLLLDTGDPQLDRQLAGLTRITTGYEDQVYYRLAPA